MLADFVVALPMYREGLIFWERGSRITIVSFFEVTCFYENKSVISNFSTFTTTSLIRYVIGFVWFVLSLVKRYYMRQFSLFAWTHVALLIVVTQSYLIIQVSAQLTVLNSVGAGFQKEAKNFAS